MGNRPPAVLLTGERGSGKTTLCARIAQSDPRFSGLLSPAVINHREEKIGFDGRCIVSGESWVFGRSEIELNGPRIGKYSLSTEGVESAISCVTSSLLSTESPTIVDEIGPLELRDGEGLAPILPVLERGGALLLVVREELISRLEPYLPRHQIAVFKVKPGEAHSPIEEIISYLTDPSGNEVPHGPISPR